MGNTNTLVQVITGDKVRVVYLTLQSDGTNETDYVVYDSSNFGGTDTLDSTLLQVWGSLSAASTARARLEWDATTDVTALDIPAAHPFYHDFRYFGGLANQGRSGITGDITLTTTGLASGDTLTLVLVVSPD